MAAGLKAIIEANPRKTAKQLQKIVFIASGQTSKGEIAKELRKLEEAGLIHRDAQGRWTCIRLSPRANQETKSKDESERLDTHEEYSRKQKSDVQMLVRDIRRNRSQIETAINVCSVALMNLNKIARELELATNDSSDESDLSDSDTETFPNRQFFEKSNEDDDGKEDDDYRAVKK